MSQHRLEKISKEMVRDVSAIIRDELRDPGLGLITVTRVAVTKDLKHAKVFVSILGSKKSRKKSLLALERARGFVQFHLGRRLRIRQVPAISFLFDESIEGAIRISQLIDKAVGAAAADEPPPAPPAEVEDGPEEAAGEEE